MPWHKEHVSLRIQTWLIDMNSFDTIYISSSEDWSYSPIEKLGKEAKVWNRFAKLKLMWRSVILEFIKRRNKDDPEWTLLDLQIPKVWSSARLFSQLGHALLVQLVLCKPLGENESRLTNDNLQPHRPLERSRDEAFSRDQVLGLPTKNADRRSLIQTLKAKKVTLEADEQERNREIELLIALLQSQMEIPGTPPTDA